MEQSQPVASYYYSEEEWSRLGCGPLPPERSKEQQRIRSHQNAVAKGNPKVDNNVVKGYN